MIGQSYSRSLSNLKASALSKFFARSMHATGPAMVYTKPPSVEGKANTVIGAGTLGRRIALMWLTQGQPVHLFDRDAKALEDAKAFIEGVLPSVLKDVPGGRAGELKSFTDRQRAIDGAWIVTECVPEILELKVEILGELDSIIPEDVILATNSSSYTASEMFGKVKNKDRLINTHYYMPPKANPVEIMPNPHTNPEIAPLVYQQAAKHGLFPYHVRKESVGLIANRIWAAIKRESLYVAAEGVARPEEIDSLLARVFGAKMTPFAGMDSVGLDVVRDIEKHYQQVRSGLPKEVLPFLDLYVDAGKLGAKSGEGFYKHPATQPHAKDHIVYLDIAKGEVRSITTDLAENKQLVTGMDTLPDGVQFDAEEGYVYWTNMGPGGPQTNDGSLQRIKVTDETGQVGLPEYIVRPGQTHTPKQLHLNKKDRKLYWCDREGGRVQRCDMDGSNLETLYDSAPGKERPLVDPRDWCVGVTIDSKNGLIYWTQKGGSKGYSGRILRANKDLPKSASPGTRDDVETLLEGLPEPIDLEIDENTSTLYWTDRGDPPFGNTLNRHTFAGKLNPQGKPMGPSAGLIIADHFHEAIGLGLDLKNNRVFVADLLGSLYQMDLDGKNRKALMSDVGNFTGLTFVPGRSQD